MKSGLTLILDRSGPMQSIASDAIGGFNAFVEAQRRAPDRETARLTLVLFDNQYEVPYKSIPLAQVPALTAATFLPRGNAALRDAIGRTLNKMTRSFAARSFAARPAADKPDKVIIAILTDGLQTGGHMDLGLFDRPLA